MFLSICSYAQDERGTILLIANTEAKVIIDGEEVGLLESNKPQKFLVDPGEHYLQVIYMGEEKNEVLNIEAGVQKVLKFEFGVKEVLEDSNATIELVKVADLNFYIPGMLLVSDDNPNPQVYYAFEKGDQIVINCNMSNAKGTNTLSVTTYPDNVTKYSNEGFRELKDLNIPVEERGIYVFTFSTNHLMDRNVRAQIHRIPESEQTNDFNTAVSWQEVYTPITIHETQKFFINSGSNATFRGGKSRVTLPINLPDNTVEWYYEFSASRDEAEINSTMESFSLIKDLSSFLLKNNVLGIGIELLTQPPGSDICDIYLLDYENSRTFEEKIGHQYILEGSRENLASGVVKVVCCNEGNYYLGLKNPSDFHGIHAAVQVVAIVKEEKLVMHQED